jgi:hypothetical protein
VSPSPRTRSTRESVSNVTPVSFGSRSRYTTVPLVPIDVANAEKLTPLRPMASRICSASSTFCARSSTSSLMPFSSRKNSNEDPMSFFMIFSEASAAEPGLDHGDTSLVGVHANAFAAIAGGRVRRRANAGRHVWGRERQSLFMDVYVLGYLETWPLGTALERYRRVSRRRGRRPRPACRARRAHEACPSRPCAR